MPSQCLRNFFGGRTGYFIGFLASFGFVAYGLYIQQRYNLDPCPLCIFQRIAFAALGLVLLLAGLHAPRKAGGRRAWGVLGLAAAAVGVGIAGRHVWLQMFPPEIPACGAPFAFMRETMDTPGLIRQVLTGTGDCGTVDWTFLGLSMPWWSLVWFAVLAAWALHAGLRRR